MNLRKEKLISFILDKLELLSIKSDQIIIVTGPADAEASEMQIIGQSIVDALRAIGKQNELILLPHNMSIQTLDEKDMKELGWIRDAETTPSNTDNSRLSGYNKSNKIITNVNERDTLRKSQTTQQFTLHN